MVKFKRIKHGRHEGKVVLNDKIIDGIVFLAVSELPYVSLYELRPSNQSKVGDNIKITLNKTNVSVQVTVKIHYSQSVSDVAFKIQEAIRHNIESMTEYHVLSVNVIVKGVTFEEIDENQDIEQTAGKNDRFSLAKKQNLETLKNSLNEKQIADDKENTEHNKVIDANEKEEIKTEAENVIDEKNVTGKNDENNS